MKMVKRCLDYNYSYYSKMMGVNNYYGYIEFFRLSCITFRASSYIRKHSKCGKSKSWSKGIYNSVLGEI